MNWIRAAVLLSVSLGFASCSRSLRPGMLTDGYGIVTQKDVEKELRDIRLPASTQAPTVFPFWRCLRPERAEMRCEDTGAEEPKGNPIAAPRLRILSGEEIYEYGTIRPWGLDACEETLAGWRAVMGSETIICISSTIESVEEPVSPGSRRTTYGEINRIKSKSGAWSYFLENEG